MRNIRRRPFLIAAGTLLAIPSVVIGQTAKATRVGWLGNSRLDTPESNAAFNTFRQELKRLGWTEGHNIQFEVRFAAGNAALFPQLAGELIERKVDMILATSGPAAAAAKRATTTLPIVFVGIPAPVETGLVASLARPGGNVTGISSQGFDLAGKRLELLKQAFPKIDHVAYLPELQRRFDEPAYRAAEKLGLRLSAAKVEKVEDLPGAIAALASTDAWFVSDAIMYYANRVIVIEQIARQRKPAMYPGSVYALIGGLMSYSVDQLDQFRRGAGFVDRILRGGTPADMPVEQPTKFEFVINLKTARTLGLAIPQPVFLLADRVIE